MQRRIANTLRLPPDEPSSQPARKLVEIVLLMGIWHRASQIRFEPNEHKYYLGLTVDDIEYEMISPPEFLVERIARIFRVLSGLDINKQSIEQTGLLCVEVGAGRSELQVTVAPNPFGYLVRVAIQQNSTNPEEVEGILRQYGMADGQDGLIEFDAE